MTQLQLTCLGDFQVVLADERLTAFSTDKVRALLVYLAVEGQAHARNKLVQLLWPGYSGESANNSLRQSLHRLRQLLHDPEADPPWLLITRQTVQFNPAAPIRIDITTFRKLLAECTAHRHDQLSACQPCLARLQQAVDLYQGDFLAGFTVADSDPFEEWRRITQEQLHLQMLDALSQLAHAAESVDDTDGALQALQRQLALEPWLEAAHRQIMRLLAQRGQRAAALAQYQRCRQVLAEELSVEPDAETTALYEQIRSGGFDKVARRQGDKVTSDKVTSDKGNQDHPATLSPLHPVTLSLPSPERIPERIKATATFAQLPPLLGRTEELAQMTTLLAQPTCRLVTLVGPPGVGKTRLAQAIFDFGSFQDKLSILDSSADPNRQGELKSKIQSLSWKDLKFKDGLHFIDLSALREPTLLATTLAHALTAAEPALQLTGERLIEQLRDKAMLLMLDNFEQVLPGVDLLRQLLAHCPQLKFLITSRVPLHLPGEQVVPIHPLPLPEATAPGGHPPQGAVALATAAQTVAVQIFCQRAAAVAPGFVLTERLAPIIVEICRRLDGLPLAIELAAARCRLLPPPALLERLTQELPARLALLTNRSQALPERQQTLRAAIAWSYDLLTADEQRIFRQLAVFVGGATLAALEAVIANDSAASDPPYTSPSLFDSIEALLDKSLLRQQEPATRQPEGEPRLVMLETLREYGWELLTAKAEGRNTQQRHADYFLTLAESAALKLHGPNQVAWLDRLALDHDNLRAALDWFVQAGELVKALRLATALRYFWRVRGHYGEGGERLLQLLAHPSAAATGGPADALRARALNAAGYLQWVQGNTAAAQSLLQEALPLGRAVPDPAATAFALRYLGLAADAQQDTITAQRLLEESLALYRTVETPNETALALMYLGDAAFGQQAYEQAQRLYQESAELLRQLGNNVVLPYALRHLGYLALIRGNHPEALHLCTESLRLNWAAGEQQGSAAALVALAAVAVAAQRWTPAARLLACVADWLATSRAQLLPIDRTYYEQTQRLLQQQPQPATSEPVERLGMAQALAYVAQELTFAKQPEPSEEIEALRPGDKVASDTVTSTSSVTESPNHPVTQSPRSAELTSKPHPVTQSTLRDWAEMPVVDFFVERTTEVAQLTAWLTPTESGGIPAQLISILGMGGMGKTTLAAAVTNAVAANFAVVIWRSLINAPPLSELLRGWLQTLSRQTLTAPPESLDEQLRLLLSYLQQARCLLVLDNVESIFAADESQSRAGVVRPGYEGYDQLLQRLATSDHQSCLLLTSREQPYALLRSGRQTQTAGRVQVLPLAGLDQTAGQVLLASNGLHASATEAAQLVENYSGNPLALQIVASTIADFFGGDVAAFQQEEGQFFDGMRLVLDQQFARLSPLEREILLWLAIEREPVTVPTLRSNFVQPVATTALLEALQALQNRSLLEKSDSGLTLQNVIIEYTTEYLVEQVCQEILDFRFLIVDSGAGESGSTIKNLKSKIQNLFLNRFALLKAQAKEYVRHSQSRMIVQPVVARLLDQFGRANVESNLGQQIDRLKVRPNPAERGYVAGNLLNLLLHAGGDLTGCDLSDMAVWQAYLRECTLHDVNFAGADLSGSKFADTFTAITTLTYSRDGKFLVAGTSLGDIRVWLAQTLQPIAMLQGHSRLVMGLAFGSEQSQLLVSGSEDGALRLWNMAKLDQPSVILYAAPGFIRTVAVSPIADLVASAGDEPDIQLWDMQTRCAVAVLRGHSNIVTAIAFSADGRFLASCSGDHTVRLWDLSAIEQSAAPQPHPPVIENSRTVYSWSPAAEDVWQIAISPDNQWLAGVNLDGMVWTWHIDAALSEKPLQVLQAQGAHQMAVSFSPDSSHLAVTASSGAIWLLDSRSGAIVRRIEGHKPLTLTLAFAPDGKTLASGGSDRTLRVWELPTGQSIQALTGAARAFRAAVFGADGQTIVTSAEDHTMRIWDVNESPAPEIAPRASSAPRLTGFCRHVLRGHSSGIWTVALDHTCTVAASAGEDSNILLWDRHSGKQLYKFEGHLDTVTALAFSPDGRTLISGSPDQTVRLWDYRTFTPVAQLCDDSPSISTHEKSIWSVALSPDGALLAAGYSDGGIGIWDIRDTRQCRQIGKLRKHEGWVRTLAFSPDGSLLASGSNDHTVRVWQVKTGSLQHLLRGHSDWVMSVAFHPHGNLLASGSFDSTIRLWNVATGEPIAAPAANSSPMRHDKGVVAVTFHPAGHLLLSASRDERMTFWHCATQQRLHNLVAPGPYSGMNITGVTGISDAQKAALKALGAVDGTEEDKVTSDKVASDKVTSTSSVTESPNYPITLSPRSAELTSKPHPVTQSTLRDWAEMPVVDFFVERTAEVAQLTAWLTPTESGGVPAQLISILGMGGMGKTTLAAAVTKAVAANFAVVIWRSLINAPPPSELLRGWLQTLSRQMLTALPESLDEQLRLLLSYLQQARCLLVLDNVESIFADDESQSRAGVVRPGYEGYDQLFQRLATSEHQSCLLLTSREQPYALLRSGRQAQTTGRLQVLSLAGLDQTAGQVLLQSNGLHTSTDEAAQLVENYSGNPLALQIVAATIADFFGGDVAAFQQEEGHLFDGLRLVLDQQFARLSPLERDILVWLAIEREPITVPILRRNFVQSIPTNELLEALHALQNRSLLEKRDAGFTLQNVIIEYTTEYLVGQVYREIVDSGWWMVDGNVDNPPSTIHHPPLTINVSFLNRFALLKAQAREEVRQSQVRLILQPLANRLLAQLGKVQVEARMMALVQRLQAAAPMTPGYAGGNLLNLLVHLGSDLRGRDFAHLALWQVFLAGVYVPDLNLAGADLTGAVFTHRFGLPHSFHFDAQGDLLLADISNQRLRLLRLHDGLLYQEVALPALRILQVHLSPGCNAVLMHLAEHQLALLDLTTGQLFPSLVRHQHSIWRVCFSPDGRLVASGDSSGLICIWDHQSGQLVQERQIPATAVSALAIAPDGVTMASATVAGTVFLWSLADPAAPRQLQGHHEEVATLTFLDNGALLASGSHDMTIGLWDVATGELRQRLRGHTRPIRKSAATATGQWLVTGGGDHFLYVWDWQRGAPLHLLTDHASPIDHLVMSADGQRAATIDLNSVVSLWDLAQGRRIDFYPIYHNAIMSIQFTPDGETLVSGGSDGAVYLWQMQEGASARLTDRLTTHKQRIFAVAVRPDGSLIASAGDGSVIALWERSSGRLLHTLQGHTGNIAMLAFSPDGQWLASSSGDGTVTLWSLPDGRQHRQLQVHTNMVGCCAFSPNRVDALGRPQQRLASGSFDHTLAIWDAESGSLLHHLHGHTNAIGRCLFSHDGQRLISISYDETVRIWEVESGQPLAVWPQSSGGYIALALHPAGEILAVSCYDHTLRLLELNSGRCLAELPGHSQIVISLCFHPNGQWLASAGADETIKLWDLSADALDRGQITCRHTMKTPAPYAGMKISGVTGISTAQKAALRALGAVEE